LYGFKRKRNAETKRGYLLFFCSKVLAPIQASSKIFFMASAISELSIITPNFSFQKDPKKLLKLKSQEMDEAVRVLDFETAAILRDEIRFLEEKLAPKKTRKK
jgi:excinuclease UvrABC helicase subunit UvrB